MLATFSNLGLTWDDLDWLRARTKLPLLVKGVLTADDARLASRYGGRVEKLFAEEGAMLTNAKLVAELSAPVTT